MQDSIINQVMDALKGMCEELGFFTDVKIGPLGPGDGLRLALSPGRPPVYHMDRRCVALLSVVFNAKHSDLKFLTGALGNIHDALCSADTYPRTDAWQITHITTESMMELIGCDPGDKWVCASAVTVTVYC